MKSSYSKQRCVWCTSDPLYIQYHDQEWGVPVSDDRLLFEMLVLESFQAGLSWLTVLRKRENFRQVLKNFDPNYVRRLTENDINQFMQNPGLIRHHKKWLSAIGNAECFLKVQKEFKSFAAYLWQFAAVPSKQKIKKSNPTTSPEAIALAKDLKKRGFKFLGATTCYAYMQAIGMVDDHSPHCFRYGKTRKQREKLLIR